MIKALKQWWHSRYLRAKRKAAERTGGQYYGSGGTIHQTGHVDVETENGQVVAVWFRCCPLPFEQSEVNPSRAEDMRRMYPRPYRLVGVETKAE